MVQASPALAATSDGDLNMPAPTTTPTISAIASRSSSTGTGCAAVGAIFSGDSRMQWIMRQGLALC